MGCDPKCSWPRVCKMTSWFLDIHTCLPCCIPLISQSWWLQNKVEILYITDSRNANMSISCMCTYPHMYLYIYIHMNTIGVASNLLYSSVSLEKFAFDGKSHITPQLGNLKKMDRRSFSQQNQSCLWMFIWACPKNGYTFQKFMGKIISKPSNVCVCACVSP